MSYLVPALAALSWLSLIQAQLDPAPRPWPDPKTLPDVEQEWAGGIVKEVTKSTITVACSKVLVERSGYDKDGRDVDSFFVIPPAVRTFQLCDHLARGEYRTGVVYTSNYRVKDVEVGDKVSIEWSRHVGIEICEAIWIRRRPGGRVPPAPSEPANQRRPWHELMNAERDFEEKGIPVPDRFLPPWKIKARNDRIAPMPREVKPRIPPAKD